jgi:hypothetical protein
LTSDVNCWIVRALEVSMRQLLLAFVVAAAGCAAQGLPIEGGGGNGPTGGGAGSGGNGGGGNNGGLPDLAQPLSGPGGSCQTACDCQPGLACQNGSCGQTQFGMIYCCESDTCPQGNFCQSSQGGFGQCMPGGNGGNGGTGPGGPPFFGDMATFPVDGGIQSFCRQIMCSQDSDCTAVGCNVCGRRGTCR